MGAPCGRTSNESAVEVALSGEIFEQPGLVLLSASRKLETVARTNFSGILMFASSLFEALGLLRKEIAPASMGLTVSIRECTGDAGKSK